MADLVEAIASFYKSRVVNDIPVMFFWMEVCFDFQAVHQNKLAMVRTALTKRRKASLLKLYLRATDIGNVELPAFTEVHRQYELLLDRIESVDDTYRRSWARKGDVSSAFASETECDDGDGDSDVGQSIRKGANKFMVLGKGGNMVLSSKAIIADLFTQKKLHDGLHDILYLLNHCMLKTISEAVVESMGCCVDVHANGKRGLDAKKYSMEAVIDRNGPPLAKADSLIEDALDSYFEEHNGKQGRGKWHFKHSRLNAKFVAKSKVCVGEELKVAKLPFLCD